MSSSVRTVEDVRKKSLLDSVTGFARRKRQIRLHIFAADTASIEFLRGLSEAWMGIEQLQLSYIAAALNATVLERFGRI